MSIYESVSLGFYLNIRYILENEAHDLNDTVITEGYVMTYHDFFYTFGCSVMVRLWSILPCVNFGHRRINETLYKCSPCVL